MCLCVRACVYADSVDAFAALRFAFCNRAEATRGQEENESDGFQSDATCKWLICHKTQATVAKFEREVTRMANTYKNTHREWEMLTHAYALHATMQKMIWNAIFDSHMLTCALCNPSSCTYSHSHAVKKMQLLLCTTSSFYSFCVFSSYSLFSIALFKIIVASPRS